jgi:hypothetical protein
VRCGPIQKEGKRAAMLTINGGRRRRLGEIRRERQSSGDRERTGGKGAWKVRHYALLSGKNGAGMKGAAAA